jgi:hypothetical protein
VYVALVEEKRNVYRVVVRKAEGRRPLGRHTHRWDTILKWIVKNIMKSSGLE